MAREFFDEKHMIVQMILQNMVWAEEMIKKEK